MGKKLELFLIHFDQVHCVFYGGQTLSGHVEIKIKEGEGMKIRGVRLLFHGSAKTHWTETESHGAGDSRTTETIHYEAEEHYFKQKITLFGRGKGECGEKVCLEPGNYNFPFSFILPLRCPTSFESGYGHIRYYCKATIDKPWKIDHVVTCPFTVLAVCDLNNDPSACLSSQGTKCKTLGCCCCKSGNIEVQVQLPKCGYVCGEMIPIRADIGNDSSRKVKRIEAKLVQVEEFIARRRGIGHEHHRTHRHHPTAILDDKEVAAREHKEWWNELRIPAVPPTLRHCEIIHIWYELHLKVVPSGPSFSLDVRLPIIIGSIPLRDGFRQISYGQPEPLGPAIPIEVAEMYPDLPPPAYQQCVIGPEGSQSQNFQPQYMYYDWSQIVQPSAPLGENVEPIQPQASDLRSDAQQHKQSVVYEQAVSVSSENEHKAHEKSAAYEQAVSISSEDNEDESQNIDDDQEDIQTQKSSTSSSSSSSTSSSSSNSSTNNSKDAATAIDSASTQYAGNSEKTIEDPDDSSSTKSADSSVEVDLNKDVEETSDTNDSV